jgi:hypothetical protein
VGGVMHTLFVALGFIERSRKLCRSTGCDHMTIEVAAVVSAFSRGTPAEKQERFVCVEET